MTLKTILVPLDGDAADAPTLTFATPLAKKLGAHLLALYVDPDPREAIAMMAGDGSFYVTPDVIDTLNARNKARRAAAEKTFKIWRAESKFPISKLPGTKRSASTQMLVEIGNADVWTQAHALVADLIITPLPQQDEADRFADLTTVLFDARRPVLATPKNFTPVAGSAPGSAPVLIAWNGSPESARALHASLDLVGLSGKVVLAHPTGGDHDAGAQRVIAFLGWHGIKCESYVLDSDQDPGPQLSAKAAELQCGLVVMGAYGHSRLREFILGGVTRHMFDTTTAPLFLVH